MNIRKFLAAAVSASACIVCTGAGYTGALPDIEAEFSYMRKEVKAAPPVSINELDAQNKEKLKPAPRLDDTYIDVIIKRDKTSEYENDLTSVIIILEKLRKCLNTDRNIQMFNAAASNLIDNIEYIRKKYGDKPEKNTASYNKLLLLSVHARETASFWTMGLAVIKYKPYTSPDNIYTKENLDAKLEAFLKEINDAVFILKNP